MKPLILVLFAQEYDELGLDPLIAGHDDYEFVREGFDFFTFPQNARILWFDVERFVDELAHKYRDCRVAAVVSTHEQFGALAASLLTAKLGLPGTPLKALLTAQHKFLARQIHSRALPEHVPPFCGFRYDADITQAVTIDYPIFVKPVKAAFSVLAKRCADEAALREHLRFRLWEKIIIKRLTWPFRRVSKKHLDCEIDADCFIAEGCVNGALQVCVDGYAHAGRVNILGTVDSVMYPGTSAFMRFEYPSRLDADVVARLEDIARRAVEAIGFTHGLFNVELFYQPASGRITIIEINPRMAGQFSDLYERVDGKSLWSLELDLALGRTPLFPHREGRFGAASSFVFREFGDAVKQAPPAEQQSWLTATYPDARLFLDLKHSTSRERETKWLGNYRYALVHMGGTDHDDMMARFDNVCEHLDFDVGPAGAKPSLWQRLQRSF
ncbi:ATP-grasp domain-containing protein [Casimicrobium huifangae]|uniref:ATP-grasp domain-containing protein n=1 Tax=Casimicrobium huifangae TaxID=2591109 RepID=UPI0012EC2783|nr:ATP-grasp domain-containing protein [Casimicrobium huifangae]